MLEEEYQLLYQICKRWITKRNITKPENFDEGGELALQFRCYIEEKYPLVYNEIIQDANCYYEILMDIFAKNNK